MWKVVRSAARSCEKGTEDTLPESGAECLYSCGHGGWYGEFTESVRERAEEDTPEWPLQRPMVRERLSPSGLPAAEDAAHEGRYADDAESAAFGSAVHAVFERITRWDESDKPEWALHPATEAERTVAACMEIPSIRELFTPPGTARIMKEQRIEAIDGNSWISGVIDRLLLHDRKRLHRGLQDGPCELSGAIAGTPLQPVERLRPHRVQNHGNTAGTNRVHHCFHPFEGNHPHLKEFFS